MHANSCCTCPGVKPDVATLKSINSGHLGQEREPELVDRTTPPPRYSRLRDYETTVWRHFDSDHWLRSPRGAAGAGISLTFFSGSDPGSAPVVSTDVRGEFNRVLVRWHRSSWSHSIIQGPPAQSLLR